MLYLFGIRSPTTFRKQIHHHHQRHPLSSSLEPEHDWPAWLDSPLELFSITGTQKATSKFTIYAPMSPLSSS